MNSILENCLKSNGIKSPSLIPLELKRELVQQLYDDGMTQSDIAVELGVNQSTVSRDLSTVNRGSLWSNRRGYVYVIRVNDFYKIGISTRPKDRLINVQTNSPYDAEIVILIKVDDMGRLERELHGRFSYCRISPKKEWFRLSDNDLEYIAALA